MLNDNVVAVCGNQDEEYMIHCYNLETGQLVRSVILENEPSGIQKVTLDGNPTLAVALP